MAYTGVKRKVFISHYKGDKAEVDAFIDEFANKHKVFTPYVLGANENDDFINSPNPDYVMTQIRKKYLQDTTVTIVLVGSCTHTCREPSAQQQAHYDRLNAAIARLEELGIDCSIPASWKWKRMHWAMSVQVIAPLEVRNEDELAELARLAKRLIRQETSLALEFPGYSYGREQWFNERALLQSSVND